MTTGFADLHLHTLYSDGSDTPERVVERAMEAGVSALAITDHDTVEGVAAAAEAAKRAGLRFLSGTELSAHFDHGDVHILGLGVQIDAPPLLESLDRMRASRAQRAERILERLAARGMPISLDATAHDGVVGRMHIAQALLAAGHVKSVQQAFDKFLQRGKPGYVAQVKMECATAIDVIHAAGGLAFIAHPGIGAPKRKLSSLLEMPFDGLEAYHSKHSPGLSEMLSQLALDRGLLITGGSDCHGEVKGKAEMGRVRLPLHYFDRICDALATRGAVTS
ncbi:MAG TPA: PHP domain-containing protein [Candidatus Hydrogenedentes bacterium]|nr:PHP domain-containing protein [Candidatus Hydrogenedentota bacterium]